MVTTQLNTIKLDRIILLISMAIKPDSSFCISEIFINHFKFHYTNCISEYKCKHNP